MPFVNRPAATLSFGLVDASGSRGEVQFNVPFGSAIADVWGAADLIRPAVAALTDCAIISQNLTFSYFDDAPGTPVPGSRVEEKGTLVFRTANGRTTRFSIPAIKDTLLRPSGAIDRSNVAIGAFVTAVTALDALWCAADGSDIRSLYHAYQAFRGTTKNQMPSDR